MSYLRNFAEFSFPRAKGSYILVLWLAAPQVLRVGKLGEFAFQAGYYLYVGSACGAGGLAGRLKHHLKPQKLHWHIDYLRSVAQLQEIWFTEDRQHNESNNDWQQSEWHSECQWAAELAKLNQLSCPYRGFGSSDCRCVAHLFYCPSADALSLVRLALQRMDRQIMGAS